MNLLLQHIKRFRFLSILASAGKKIKYIPFLPIIVDEQVKLYIFLFYPRKFIKMKTLISLIRKEINPDISYHRFGGIEFQYNEKEIAHIHSNGLLDIYFPKKISILLIDKGLCCLHHVFPSSGWTSVYLNQYTDLSKCLH